MASYFFVGDGCEVLACEAYEANARAVCAELQAKTDDVLKVYQCDPSEVTTDAADNAVWAYPAERAIAEREYDLPSLAEAAR